MAYSNANSDEVRQDNMDSESKNENDDSESPVHVSTKRKLGTIKKYTFLKNWIGIRDIHVISRMFLKKGKKNEARQQKPVALPYNRTMALVITNFPTEWSDKSIKNFLEAECPKHEEIYINIIEGVCGVARVVFSSHIHLIVAKAMLQRKEIDGNKLIVTDEYNRSRNNPMASKPTRPRTYRDVWDVDPEGLYGLRLPFLSALNITPPITKWVHVHNFTCDKDELREVMDLAGEVVLCNLDNGIFKVAKVMYSHPLEAVQAVSMLNGRMFHDRCLMVSIDKPGDNARLPKGLSDLGPGLGKNGKPVWKIAQQYENFVQKKKTLINTTLFTTVDDSSDDEIPRDDEVEGLMDGIEAVQAVNGPAEELPMNNPAAEGQVANGDQPPEAQNLVLNPLSILNAPMRGPAQIPNPNIVPREVAPQVINPMQLTANSNGGTLPPPAFLNLPGPSNMPPGVPNAPLAGYVRHPENPGNLAGMPSVPSVIPGKIVRPEIDHSVHSWGGAGNLREGPVSTPVAVPNYPPPGLGPQQMYQNPNMYKLGPVVPQDLWRPENISQQMPMEVHTGNLGPPRMPLVPTLMRPQFGPENRPHPTYGITERELFGPRTTALINAGHPVNHVPVHGVTEYNKNVQFPGTMPSCTVVLHNLPVYSLDVLIHKLSVCGTVIKLKSPAPNTAIATFATVEQADNCIQLYNGYPAGGRVLEVNFI